MIFLETPVTITGFPMPPSDNKLKQPTRRPRKGGGGLVLSLRISDEYKAYKESVRIWFYQNNRVITPAIDQILYWKARGIHLGIHCDVRLHKLTIYNQDGTVRKWDVTNRMKALHDCWSEISGIDDSIYFNAAQDKVEIPDFRKEAVTFRIGPIARRRED